MSKADLDLFDYSAAKPAFKDIRPQRYTTASNKAELCKRLNELLHQIPPRIRDGDIKTVRDWRVHWDKAKKVLSNQRSSVNELTTALTQMESYYEEPKQ